MTTFLNADNAATIQIVGSGLTGISTAVQQIHDYIDRHESGENLPALTIRLFDASGAFGPGIVYPQDDNGKVFLLNQPASAMSPFPDRPNDFIDWRKSQGRDGNPHAFASRAEYGAYLKDKFKQAVDRAVQRIASSGADITVETVPVKVSKLIFNSNTVVVKDDQNKIHRGDALILADGHQKKDAWQNLKNSAAYFESPYNISAIQDALEGKADDVAIIGTGQSTVDVLAVLDHIGYQGTIHAFSRDGVLPWAIHPERYKGAGAKPEYQPVILSQQSLTAARKTGDDNALVQLLEREIESAQGKGYDIGHVVTSPAVRRLIEKPATNGVQDRLLSERFNRLYANPTPPQRYDLIQRLIASGQLQIVKQEIGEDTIKPTADGTFEIKQNGADKPLKVSALFNAACYERNPLASPLLRQAQKAGFLIETAEGGIKAGQQKRADLYVSGPAAHPKVWGVETFRATTIATAKECLNNVLAEKTENAVQAEPRFIPVFAH